jgi:aryl-alcohol dehydrogenase
MPDSLSMRAAVVREAGGPFVLEALRLEAPRADEVLVRIAGVGVCHTDLICRDQVYPVPFPVVLGHEGSGVVEAVGEAVDDIRVGDHVVLSFNACGSCRNCLRGMPSRCLAIFESNFACMRSDGSSALSCGVERVHGHFFAQSSFASHALARRRSVVKIRDDVPLALMGPLGCGIQSGAGAVLNNLQPPAGSSLAVFGCGAVGLSAVMAAVVAGCTDIVAIDPNPLRRQLALELGAHRQIDPASNDPVVCLQQGGGVDSSVECTGLPQVMRQAVDALNVTGTCALIGAAPPGTEVTLDMNSIMFGRTVRGVIEGDAVPAIFIPTLVELYRQGRFPIDRLVRFYPLDDIQQAVADAEQGLVVKAVLVPGKEESR